MLFHISPSENDIIKRTNGDAFLRVGDSSRQLSSEEITALEYSKGIRSFETRIISEATVEDLDFNLIEEYRQLVEAAPTTHPLDLLRARGIIRGPDNNPRITVAAIASGVVRGETTAGKSNEGISTTKNARETHRKKPRYDYKAFEKPINREWRSR